MTMTMRVRLQLLASAIVLTPACAWAQEAAILREMNQRSPFEIFANLFLSALILSAWIGVCIGAVILYRVTRQRVRNFINRSVTKLGGDEPEAR